MSNKSCFIIMPFSSIKAENIDLNEEQLTYIYEKIFKKAISEYEIADVKIFSDIKRYDKKTGSIIGGIINDLNNADLVLADLTGLNPNVMYELGVRHSLKRGTIIVSQDRTKLPSDLRDYFVIDYNFFKDDTLRTDKCYEKFKYDLHSAMDEVFKFEKPDSPVINHLTKKLHFANEEIVRDIKKNIIIADYLFENFHEIRDAIEKLEEANFEVENPSIINSLLIMFFEHMAICINDLEIPFNSSLDYENFQSAKLLINELSKTFQIANYFEGLPADASVLKQSLKDLLNKKYLNPFNKVDLKTNVVNLISFKEVFSEDGDFYLLFLQDLEDYLETKAKEYSISEEEINKMLSS